MHDSLLLYKKSTLQSSTLTLNPADMYASGVTLSNGNKTVAFDSTIGGSVRGTIGRSSGKWYFEVRITGIETGSGGYTPGIGVAPSTTGLYHPWNQGGPGELLLYSYTSNVSAILYGNAQRFAYGTYAWLNDVIGVAMDLTSRTMKFYKNGIAFNSFDYTPYSAATTFYPMISGAAATGSNSSANLLTGVNLAYPLPAGYNAW